MQNIFFTPNILHVAENSFEVKFVPLYVTSTLGIVKRIIISSKKYFATVPAFAFGITTHVINLDRSSGIIRMYIFLDVVPGKILTISMYK